MRAEGEGIVEIVILIEIVALLLREQSGVDSFGYRGIDYGIVQVDELAAFAGEGASSRGNVHIADAEFLASEE